MYVSATPATYELSKSTQVAEMIIRPTGLVDPEIEVRPTKHQVDDLMEEIRERIGTGERVLVTTLTKKMAEDLTDFLLENGLKVRYLHSEVETLERIAILRDLRKGVFDVLVGINLLREGLDLPEVSLVGILDADKEGYLRSGTSLIQTIGRAARNVEGRVIMYADVITESMARAIGETKRRRERQVAFNLEHGIEPKSVRKEVRDILDLVATAEETTSAAKLKADKLPREVAMAMANEIEKKMKECAANLEFEKAAALRDELLELRKQIGGNESVLFQGRRRRSSSMHSRNWSARSPALLRAAGAPGLPLAPIVVVLPRPTAGRRRFAAVVDVVDLAARVAATAVQGPGDVRADECERRGGRHRGGGDEEASPRARHRFLRRLRFRQVAHAALVGERAAVECSVPLRGLGAADHPEQHGQTGAQHLGDVNERECKDPEHERYMQRRDGVPPAERGRQPRRLMLEEERAPGQHLGGGHQDRRAVCEPLRPVVFHQRRYVCARAEFGTHDRGRVFERRARRQKRAPSARDGECECVRGAGDDEREREREVQHRRGSAFAVSPNHAARDDQHRHRDKVDPMQDARRRAVLLVQRSLVPAGSCVHASHPSPRYLEDAGSAHLAYASHSVCRAGRSGCRYAYRD